MILGIGLIGYSMSLKSRDKFQLVRMYQFRCAQGFLEKLLIERWGCRVEGWDYRDARWDNQLLDSWKFRLHDISSDWPACDSPDTIFALEVIEHMIDTDLFLDRCHDLLPRNGKLVLSTPNIACLTNRFRLLTGKYPYLMEYRNVIHHVRMYTVPVLVAHLEKRGFRVRFCRGVNFLPIRSHKLGARGFSVLMANKFPSFCSRFIGAA